MDYLPLTRLHQQLGRLSRQELVDRLHAVRALGTVRGLRYLDEKSRPRTIDVALVPWVLTPAQITFFGQVTQLVVNALLKLPGLYVRDRRAREILPLDPETESWVRVASHPSSRPLAVMGRLDSTATFSHRTWRQTYQLLEVNGVGVGGIHYAPAGCSVILDVLGDVLQRAFPGHQVVPTPDPRQLLIDELTRVGRRLGRRVRRVALVENTEFTTGTDEFVSLARDLRAQGLEAMVVDPRMLRLSRGHITAQGRAIDLVYRDCELSEFIDMERRGRKLTAIRQAIREGRLVSGLLWEFDHKSCWEIFTDPTYARLFTPAQRRLFRDHLPWTRLVRDARVRDPKGRDIDLVPYIRRGQERLVLKPNLLYGGEGIVVGRTVSRAVWERTLAKALHGRMRYVVQRLAPIATHTFPGLDHGMRRTLTRHVVSGFFFNSSGVGLVGRFSEDPVVNVSRGGGLLSALMIQ